MRESLEMVAAAGGVGGGGDGGGDVSAIDGTPSSFSFGLNLDLEWRSLI